MEMFKNVLSAIRALEELTNLGHYQNGKPIVDTEVYNEGWMLRLIVSKLHDMEPSDFERNNGTMARVARRISELSRRGWCSEGGVSPLFKRGGVTWADGLIGDIELAPQDCKRKKKWGFLSKGGVIAALEAKMGSDFSSDTKNYQKLDQLSRYVSCLARIMVDYPAVQGELYAFVPEVTEKLRGFVKKSTERAINLVKDEYAKKIYAEYSLEGVVEAIKKIRPNVVQWYDLVELIRSVAHDNDAEKDAEYIEEFYKAACRANGINF